MHADPQSTPSAVSSTHTTNVAAGPHSALGVPSVGAALARPAALYLTLTDGTVLVVGNATFREPTASERAQFPMFRRVLARPDADLAFMVNAAYEGWLREQECEPAHDADRETYYMARFGGAR